MCIVGCLALPQTKGENKEEVSFQREMLFRCIIVSRD